MFGFFLWVFSLFGFFATLSILSDNRNRYRRERIIYLVRDKEVELKSPTIVKAEVVKDLDKNKIE